MNTRSLAFILALLLLPLFLPLLFPRPTLAEVTCIKASNKVVNKKVVTSLVKVKRSSTCRTGEVEAVTGPRGPQGDDGELRVYGDGSAGAKVVATSGTYSNVNSMHTDFTVESGATLSVPSGTVIRCTGSFENNGTIVVPSGLTGGNVNGQDSTSIMPSLAAPLPGVSLRAAASGEFGNSSADRSGGSGGVGISAFQARQIRYPGPHGGGAGAGGFTFSGGAGGGTVVILCAGPIVNNGTIRADGSAGLIGGGGGGGIIILASKTSVTSPAGSSIIAKGGDGAASSVNTAAGGVGGGGIIHTLAPEVDISATTLSVSHGGAGGILTDVTGSIRSGGHGGGACGGFGGKGADIEAGSTTSGTTTAGTNGHVLISELDPTGLF